MSDQIYHNSACKEIHPDSTSVVFAIGTGVPTQAGEWIPCTATESASRIEAEYQHLYTCAGVRYYGKL